MRKEEQLLAYLKGACPGRQHAAPGRRLRDILGVSESRLHEMVNHLRQEGYPIGSGRDGYFYIRTFGEARETEEHLARMIRGLEAARQGLYLPQMEHDACGIGAVVSIEGFKTRSTVDQALKIVEKLEHRAGKDADGTTGDGVGIMTQIPHAFFSRLELGFDLPGAGLPGSAGRTSAGLYARDRAVLYCPARPAEAGRRL